MIRSEVLDSEVARNAMGQTWAITPPSERRSGVFLTKFEVARIVGERARQIINGAILNAPPSHHGDDGDALAVAERCTDPYSLAVDPVMIAKQELVQRKIAMTVRRIWPDGFVEYIPVRELCVDVAMLDMQM